MNRNELEHWDKRYVSGDAPWDTGRPSAELLRQLARFPTPPCRAIEFGCGTGTNAIWLVRQGFDVTAIDISPTAIARARLNAKSQGVEVRFLAADVCSLPDLGEPFDFFFDRGCYHAVRRVNSQAMLETFRRWTSDRATGIVLTGNSREERKPGPPALSEATILAELGKDFEILALDEFRFDQDELDGHRHLGWSAVLRKIARI